jgi:hypothetical protein
MKKRREKLIYEQRPLPQWLFEQAEDAPAEETPDEAIEAEDEEEPEAAAEDADAPADEAVEEVEPEEEVKLSKSIDQDLEALLIDFETQARQSREIEADFEEDTITVEESLGLGFLLEQAELPNYEEEIDLDRFSSEVARLVKNYTSLLDMEKMLINKAREFIMTRYGEAAEKELIDILADKHDIEVVEISGPPESNLDTPIAVGAMPGGGGAAGG